jgi:hypothetical protein
MAPMTALVSLVPGPYELLLMRMTKKVAPAASRVTGRM